MRKRVLAFFFCVATTGLLIAQCPVILNCPQGSPIVCDLSANDSLFWNEPPYTWSQSLQSADLYEGTADFSFKILGCFGGGAVSVSYVLILDLDNDNLPETAISSANFPPSGKVFANNAFNPNYSGGDLVVFDKRAVPDSLKFRFALETNTLGDTTFAHLRWSANNQFVSPRLPEGRHHLTWRVEQDGKIKYCEHAFRLKDCLAPTLFCQANASVAIDSSRTASLLVDDALESVEDNITPNDLLQFSFRKTGDGSGFPLDSVGNPISQLIFNCEMLDSQAVELWVRDRSGNASSCGLTVTVLDDDEFCVDPPVICARTFWNDSTNVQFVNFKTVWTNAFQKFDTLVLPTMPDGCALLNLLPPASSFSLIAEKDTNPLNGVSTFDLFLITKHILGIQPLDAPWKWLAADANRSGTITTFDVVELRKLILGLHNKLPSNTSWRFFAADCDFPPNPFTGYCPAEYSFQTMPLWNYPSSLIFNGLKVGDVNGMAKPDLFTPSTSEERGETAFVCLPDLTLKAGEVSEIPLKLSEAGAWLGFQLGLQFDPNLLEIEEVKSGTLPGWDETNWAQPQPGALNLSWFDVSTPVILPDEKLLVLRVRARTPVSLREVVSLSTERLHPEIYIADERIRPVQLLFAEKLLLSGQAAILSPQPNPTTGGTSIPIRLAQPENVLLEVSDFSGKTIFQQEIPLGIGVQMLEIPGAAFSQTGVYAWRIRVGNEMKSGKIVRI